MNFLLPSEFALLLATDSSDEAFEAIQLLTQIIDLGRANRVRALLLAWPEHEGCDDIPLIGESELGRFERFAQLLEHDGAIIEGERASGTSAEDLLAGAEAIDASMIVLALARNDCDDRGNRLIAQIVDRSPLPVLTFFGAERKAA